jgi:hypothetical protein
MTAHRRPLDERTEDDLRDDYASLACRIARQEYLTGKADPYLYATCRDLHAALLRKVERADLARNGRNRRELK